jgi:hypothetical protein
MDSLSVPDVHVIERLLGFGCVELAELHCGHYMEEVAVREVHAEGPAQLRMLLVG